MVKVLHVFVVGLLLSVFSMVAIAAPPILEISGKIDKFTDKGKGTYNISEREFLALKQSSIITSTTWTRVTKFSGVKIEDLLRVVGSTGETVEFTALDGYKVSISIAEIKKYGIILARNMDDKPLEIKNWGPYWVMYPRDAYPKELGSSLAESRFIWQVKRINVK